MTDVAIRNAGSRVVPGEAHLANASSSNHSAGEEGDWIQATCEPLRAPGLSKPEELMAGLVVLLVFNVSQLAAAQAAGCMTVHRCAALNRFVPVEQPSGLAMVGTPAMARPAAPPQPIVTPGSSELEVSWKAPTDHSGSQMIEYDVQYSDDGGSTWRPWHISPQLETLTVNILGLKNGITYAVRVRARNSQGDGPWSASASAMPLGVPSAPVELTLMPGDGKLRLSWVAPADHGGSEIVDYDIEYSNDGGSTSTRWNESPESTTLTDEITNLNNGTTYHLRVRARNGVGHGPWSAWAEGQPSTVPATPAAPTLTPGYQELHVSWNEPSNNGGSGIIDYDVQYSDDSGSTWREWHASAESVALKTTITGLQSGTTYAVQVRAENRQGGGPWSVLTMDTPLGVPAAPAPPTLTSGDGQLEVSWDEPSDNGGSQIINYQVQYSDDNGSSWNEWDTLVDSPALQTTISGLQNGTIYQVQVRARNSQGDGPWSALVMGIPLGMPAAPAPPTLAIGDGQLEVSWAEPSNNGGSQIMDYDVRYSGDGGSSWREWHAPADPQALRTTIMGLGNGNTYAVQVRAENRQGDGPWSASAIDTPLGVPAAPAPPTLISGDGQLEVSWDEPSNNGGSEIMNYNIQYSDDNSSTWREWRTLADPQALQTTVMDLNNGNTYNVQVRAENRQGDGPWSASASATPSSVPAAPAPPTVTPGSRQLDVSWGEPSDNGGSQIMNYDVQYSGDGGSTWWEWHTSVDLQSPQTTIAGLNNGITYNVQVRAENRQGDGPWSASSTEQPLGAPTAPAPPTLKPGNGQLEVSWDEPSDNGGSAITGYDIQYSSDSGSAIIEHDLRNTDASVSTSQPSDDPVILRTTIPNLDNGITYNVQVRARNRQGKGPWSEPVTGRPRLLPTWMQWTLSGLIWPIIVAIIANAFKIDIKRIVKDRLSLLKQDRLQKQEKKQEKKVGDPVSPEASGDKPDEDQ